MAKEFDSLKHWKKKALYLATFEEMNGAEISRALGVPERTVQDNLKRLKGKYDLSVIYDPDKEDIKFDGTKELVIKYPKILFYDIETALAIAYHFNHWKVNISRKHKIKPSHMLSHAWQWGLDGKVEGSILTQLEAIQRDDERIVHECWHLLNNCDVLVAHNAKSFDVKKVNGFFLKYGLNPPSPYKVYDTLSVCKRKFSLDFNNLAFVAEYLGVEQKIDTDIDLWIGCAEGRQEALDEMLEYNIGDITTLVGVFKKLIVWDNDGVNMALFNQNTEVACPHCSGDDIVALDGRYVYTPQCKYQAFRCSGCGATLRGNQRIGTKNAMYRVL